MHNLGSTCAFKPLRKGCFSRNVRTRGLDGQMTSLVGGMAGISPLPMLLDCHAAKERESLELGKLWKDITPLQINNLTAT